MKNPYFYNASTLVSSARRAFEVTPSDDDNLPQVCKALRIWNPTEETANVKVLTVFEDEVTVHVPAGALWVESLVISKVFATGTTVDVILVGYSD